MSEFRLSIRTANDAFQNGDAATSVANILRDVANKIEGWDSLPNHAESLFDYNGNRVGQFKLHTDDTEADDTEADDTEAEPVSLCPVCGDPIDYCTGHGEIGDPHGFALMQAHDDGNHTGCVPDACDDYPRFRRTREGYATVVTVLRSATRENNSNSGNPVWTLHTDAGQFRTEADASVGYDVDNLLNTRIGAVNKPVRLSLTGKGHVAYLDRAQNA